MNPNEYQCAMCGNVYEKTRSDEEAHKECVENFGYDLANGECDIVCDDCHNKMIEIEPPSLFSMVERYKKEVNLTDEEVHEMIEKGKIIANRMAEVQEMCNKIALLSGCTLDYALQVIIEIHNVQPKIEDAGLIDLAVQRILIENKFKE